MSIPYDVDSPLHRAFIENVKARRLELDLTQEQVAKKLKIAQSSYAEIEGGRRTPTLESVEKVAKALKIEPLALLAAPVEAE